MKELGLACLLISFFACQNASTKGESQENDSIAEAPTKIEALLELKAPREEANLTVEFILYDNEPLEEESSIAHNLNNIAKQLHFKYDLAIETDTVYVHVWRSYDEYLEAQKNNIGTEYRGSGGYIINKTNIAVFYALNIVDVTEHEFVHASSLRINENFGEKSRWLWEAFAIYEADEFVHPKDLSYLRNGTFPSIAELNGDFDGGGANRIYEVGYLLSEFVIEKWSSEHFLNLVKTDANIEKVLSISTAEFEKQWKQFVLEKYLK